MNMMPFGQKSGVGRVRRVSFVSRQRTHIRCWVTAFRPDDRKWPKYLTQPTSSLFCRYVSILSTFSTKLGSAIRLLHTVPVLPGFFRYGSGGLSPPLYLPVKRRQANRQCKEQAARPEHMGTGNGKTESKGSGQRGAVHRRFLRLSGLWSVGRRFAMGGLL